MKSEDIILAIAIFATLGLGITCIHLADRIRKLEDMVITVETIETDWPQYYQFSNIKFRVDGPVDGVHKVTKE